MLKLTAGMIKEIKANGGAFDFGKKSYALFGSRKQAARYSENIEEWQEPYMQEPVYRVRVKN